MQNAGCALVERFSALALSLSLSLFFLSLLSRSLSLSLSGSLALSLARFRSLSHTQVERFRALVQYDKALESGEPELPPQRREWLRTQVLSLLALLVQKYKYRTLRSRLPSATTRLVLSLLALLVQKYQY